MTIVKKFMFMYVLVAGFFPSIIHAQENPLLNLEFWKTATAQDVKTALDRGANIHAQHIENEMAPLHFAAAFSKIPETLALLLKQGADIEAREMSQSTPLHFAAGWNETPEVVALLLEHGADIEARDTNGWTPLHTAARNSKTKMVALLLKQGADVEARSDDRMTPLHRASVTSNTPKVVALLLDHGADIEARDTNGWTPLQIAAAASRTPETIVLLLERGANTQVYDRNGKTPFDYIKENEHLRESKTLRNLDIRQNVLSHDSQEITTSRVHHNGCEISVGDKVNFHNPAEIYTSMKDMQLVKDEFETTAAFEKRVAEATSAFNEPVLLRGTYDREQTNYDADNSRIVMKRYAWDNIGFGWNDVFGYDNDYGIKASLTDNHATTLQSNELITGTFTGSNAYGASVEVTQILRTSYGVFDRTNDSRKETWEDEIWVGKHATPAVSIPMFVDEAKRVISKLQVGILAKPRKPFVAEGRRHWKAKIDNPTEVTENYHVIVADMICAVITDDKGRVLKTVETTY